MSITYHSCRWVCHSCRGVCHTAGKRSECTPWQAERYLTQVSNHVLQVHTFNIGIFPGAILPFIIGYWADAATAVGDITATEEASGVEERGPAHDERIQGCLLADGACLTHH